MKKVFGVLLTILILLIGFQQAIIVTHFKLNQKDIEEKFCINKNKPELQCHGKCYLKNKLQKTNNSEPTFNNIYQKIDLLPVTTFKFKEKLPIKIKSRKFTYGTIHYVEPCQEVLEPPPVI
ncbi:MAG: hypothetical protein ACK5MD_04495 [Flavobacteriales bacterium]